MKLYGQEYRPEISVKNVSCEYLMGVVLFASQPGFNLCAHVAGLGPYEHWVDGKPVQFAMTSAMTLYSDRSRFHLKLVRNPCVVNEPRILLFFSVARTAHRRGGSNFWFFYLHRSLL